MSTIQNITFNRYKNRNYECNKCQVICIYDTDTDPNNYSVSYDGKDGCISIFTFNDVKRKEAGFITKQEAEYLVEDLRYAKNRDTDVVVQCPTGISRSGTVTQFAVDYFGFTNISIDTPSEINSHLYQMLVEAYDRICNEPEPIEEPSLEDVYVITVPQEKL
jgi:hypothetical protein